MTGKKISPAGRPGKTKLTHPNDTMLVSIYQNFSDTNPKNISVSDLVEQIRSGRYQNQIDRLRALKQSDPETYRTEKTKLPFVLMAGVFTRRSKTGLATPSELMIQDLDGLPTETIDSTRAAIQSDKHVCLCFVSPSGQGLKYAVCVDVKTDFEYKAAFKQISEHFRSSCGVAVDQSGSDISRACFVSYDPDVYHNPDAARFEYELPAAEPVRPHVASQVRGCGRLERYVLSVINGELARVTDAPRGMGNSSLNTAALRVGQIFHCGLFDKGPVQDHFINVYLQRGGHSRHEAEKTFNSGWTAGTNSPRNFQQGGCHD